MVHSEIQGQRTCFYLAHPSAAGPTRAPVPIIEVHIRHASETLLSTVEVTKPDDPFWFREYASFVQLGVQCPFCLLDLPRTSLVADSTEGRPDAMARHLLAVDRHPSAPPL